MKKRTLHTLFSAILCGAALILPAQSAFASAGSIGLDPAVGITLFHEKKLDLSAIDSGIYLTENDCADILEQIRRDFLTDFAYVVSDVAEKQKELEASGVPLRLEDGSYNPDWDEQWNQIYPNDRTALYTSLRGKYGDEKKALLSADGVTDEIRLYARESFLYIGQNPLIDPYVQKAQKILDENGIYFTAADTTAYPLTGNDQKKPGTIAWHEAFDNVLGGTIDNY